MLLESISRIERLATQQNKARRVAACLTESPMPHFQELHVFMVGKFISTFATTPHLFGKWRKSLIPPLHQVSFSQSVLVGVNVYIFFGCCSALEVSETLVSGLVN